MSMDVFLEELKKIEMSFWPKESRTTEWRKLMIEDLTRKNQKEIQDIQELKKQAQMELEKFRTNIKDSVEQNILYIQKKDGMRVEETYEGVADWEKVYSKISNENGMADIAKGIISQIIS